LNVVQIAVINSEYRSVFCVLYAHHIKDLKEWRKTSLNTLRVFDQNQGMHAILVDKAMLERDPAFVAEIFF
jgi:hypothetical protein